MSGGGWERGDRCFISTAIGPGVAAGVSSSHGLINSTEDGSSKLPSRGSDSKLGCEGEWKKQHDSPWSSV